MVFVNSWTNNLVGLDVASEDGKYYTTYHLPFHKDYYRFLGHLGRWKAISNWLCNVVETILIMNKNENKIISIFFMWSLVHHKLSHGVVFMQGCYRGTLSTP